MGEKIVALTPQQREWQATHITLRNSPRWSPDARSLLDEAMSFVPQGETMETSHLLLAVLGRASTDPAVAARLSEEDWLCSADRRVEAMDLLMSLPAVSTPVQREDIPPISKLTADILRHALSLSDETQAESMDVINILLTQGSGIGLAVAKEETTAFRRP